MCMGLPGGSDGKESACNADDPGLIPGLGREDPWKRKWQLTLVFLPGKFHGQSSLAGYIPWGSQRVRHDLVTYTTTNWFWYLCSKDKKRARERKREEGGRREVRQGDWGFLMALSPGSLCGQSPFLATAAMLHYLKYSIFPPNQKMKDKLPKQKAFFF